MSSAGNRTPRDDDDTTSLAEDFERHSVNFRGDRIPAAFVYRLHRKRNLACAAILFTVFCERVAFYALAGNLYLFLNHHPLAWTSATAMTALLVFTGTTFVGSFFTGYLGDALGRFRVILVSLFIYILGFLSFVAIAQFQTEGGDFIGLCRIVENTTTVTTELGVTKETTTTGMQCGSTIYILLVIVGLASSGIKANIVPFGAEQVKQEQRSSVRRFFTMYYWVLNMAAFLSILVLSYIQQSSPGGFGLGYIIPTAFLVMALFVFWCAKTLYTKENPDHPVLYSIFQVLVEAWRQNRITQSPPRVWLDAAKIEFGGRFDNELVEDVKQLKFVIGVFALLMPYWVLYFQMQTSFQEQGLHMRLHPYSMFVPYDRTTFTIPTAWLTLFNVMFVILFVPVFEKIIYPQLDRREITPSMNLRILAGLVFAVVAMLCAGGVEVRRLSLMHNNQTIIQVIDGTEYEAADMWVFWQIPQYSFVGLSEILASITGVELAYSHAPASMQGVVMGLFYLSTGIGCFAGSFLLFIVTPYWIKGDCSADNHMDYYFWLLASIQTAAAILFYFLIVRRTKSEVRVGTYTSIQ